MDLERLQEFAAIAQHGSLKSAALALDLSVATLSARLLRFEAHLGTPLFERNGTAMKLTATGKQLLPHAAEILSQYDQVKHDMRRAQEHSYHKLRIAVTGSTLPLHLGPFLDQLILKHPDMHLDLLDDSQYSLAEGLISGAVDLYFAPTLGESVPKGLIRKVIAHPGESILLPRSHPLAGRSMISIRELDGEQFILYPQTAEASFRNFQLKNLQDSGIRYTLYESDTAVLFNKLLVPIGKGLLLYTHIMDSPPNTVCIPITDLPHHVAFCFFYRKSNPSPDVLAFERDYLKFVKEATHFEHRQTL